MSEKQAGTKNDSKKGTSRNVEGVKFVCINPPFSKSKPGTREFYKNSTKNGVEEVNIGRLFDCKAMSRKHAILTFKDSKVYITDAGSEFGTWVENKGVLKSKILHELQDGAKIVFGAREEKGMKEDPEAVRVLVTLLKTRPKAPTIKKLDVPASPPIKSSNSNTSNTLKPPDTPSKHRRTVSFDLPKNHGRSSSVSSTRTDKDNELSTNLNKEIKIPWAETFRLGYGVDALTGESTATCALQPFKNGPPPELRKGETFVEVLHWNKVNTFRDEYEMEIGGSINVACPVSMSTRVASLLSENSTSSTILIQYRQTGVSEMEFLPPHIALKQGLEKMSEKEFRDKYGDYYIAGCQRSYNLRMIIICKVNDNTVTDSHEIEAKMLVENFFKAGAKHEKLQSKSQNCSMLHVVIETFGCSTDASRLSNGVLSVDEALKALPKILKNPKGAPRTALLYHYSTLDAAKLSRQIQIPRNVFDKVHEMRDMYLALQTSLLHPALKQYEQECSRIRSALKAFERKRTDLIHIRKVDSKEKRLEDGSVYRDLSSAKRQADTILRRYEFIRDVKNMPRDCTCHAPIGAGDKHYEWVCGKVKGKLKKKLSDFKHITFDSSYEAFEADWVSPVTLGPGTVKQLFGIGSGPKEHMNFIRRDTSSLVGRVEMPKKSTDAVRVRSTEEEDNSFTFQLAGRRVYIIGWTLSCDWEGKRDPGPVIKVEDDNNFILRDHLSIRLDTSHPAAWRCRVTFVFQSAHDFPDLNLQGS